MIRVALADDASDLRFLVRIALESDGRFEVVCTVPAASATRRGSTIVSPAIPMKARRTWP